MYYYHSETNVRVDNDPGCKLAVKLYHRRLLTVFGELVLESKQQYCANIKMRYLLCKKEHSGELGVRKGACFACD